MSHPSTSTDVELVGAKNGTNGSTYVIFVRMQQSKILLCWKKRSPPKKIEEVEDEENPDLPSAYSDSVEVELKSDTCDVFFSEVTELPEHISEAHPGIKLKVKRIVNNDEKRTKGRRVKTAPEKSLPNGQ